MAIGCQTVSCNALRSIEQRLARLLLIMADRLSANEVPVTQECIGRMIGARRTSVTKAAGDLHSRHILDYERGIVTILDRAKL